MFKIRTNCDGLRLLHNKPGDENGLCIFLVSLVAEVSGCEDLIRILCLISTNSHVELSDL